MLGGFIIALILLVLIGLYRYLLFLVRTHLMDMRADQSTERLEAGQPQPQPTLEPIYTGLDPSIIASLPVYVCKQTDQSADDNGRTRECAVCLSSFEDEEVVMLLPNCKHMFHAQCINMWFSSHTTCPICRCGAEPRMMSEPKENRVDWLQFPALELDYFRPITPSSEGTSDGTAQAFEGG
ncbi:hypothetical protein NE237_000787 [Protea cynaroides]|uniref:RING-type E3 ubiquitin transferase n=1 Tax=Protea cynaroides TaxID=273540 RepID=A0A9Q0KSX5_9MAGN|nr:hypothetical protein NE237_000787 [Protea cynaroides]